MAADSGDGAFCPLDRISASAGGGQRPEFDQRDHRQPEQLRDHAAERVAPVQVIGAVRADDGDALAVQHAGEERDQMAGAGVGPVQVLDDQQDRAFRGQLGQQAEHRAEHLLAGQARPVDLVGLLVAVREQARQHRAGLDRLLDARRGGAERVRERQVRDAVADLGALAAQHGEAVALGDPHRLVDQAGLADAGVAADEPGDRAARGGVVQEGAQPGQLRIPSHQRAHVSIIRRGLHLPANQLPPASAAQLPEAGTTRPFGIRV